MKLEGKSVLRALAGNYVLGGMTTATRRRFDTLLHERAELDACVEELEAVLLPMELGIRQVQAPTDVLPRIRAVGAARRPHRHTGPFSWQYR